MTRRMHPISPEGAALSFALILSARSVSAFFMPVPSSSPMMFSSRKKLTSSHHQRSVVNRGVMKMVSSVAEDDPWVLLEEFHSWAKSGKYDVTAFENVINSLRNECRFNVNTLEKEIASIQQALENTSGDWSSRQHAHDNMCDDDRTQDASGPIPTVKAVFAGFRVTEEDRNRLHSAHPEEYL
mmetsp:Transcript_14315/g.25587  ORF Transcript_14315/g.25587 Transcript_14315/m.25587 type:complete len:183 (-) Transcript_14315:39-587(-)